jgi:putative ATP-dependent endonuclease of OLD family
MRIARIHIENFRCLRSFDLTPKPGMNVLIGENNTGKSSLLIALDRALGRGTPAFDLEDFFADAPNAPSAPPPTIRIDLELRPLPAPDFSAAFTTEFVDDIDFDQNSAPFLRFRTEASFDAAEGRIHIDYFSVKADGTTRRLAARKRFTLRGFVPFYLADAFRDAIRELRNRRGFWGRLVDSIHLDPATEMAAATALRAINASIVTATPRLAEVRDRFREIGQIIPTAPPPDDVIVNPVAADPAAILRNLEVLLRTFDSPRGFGLDRHGEGTRSVGYLVIYRAFVDLLAREENDNLEAEPILGVEEPEAHLHPHARRAIAGVLGALDRQTFITTHSTAIARHVAADSVTLLRRVGPACVASQIPGEDPVSPGVAFFTPRQRSVLDRELRSGAAEAFFARSVLLFEGESEIRALPFFARALGIDLNRLGVSLVPVDGKAYGPLVKMLGRDALRVPWVILADAEKPKSVDDVARELVKAGCVTTAAVDAARAAGRLREDILLPHDCFTLDAGHDLEAALVQGGACPEYEAAITAHPDAGTLADFVAADATRATLSQEARVQAFMKHERWGRPWKVLFAAIVAESITAGGTNPARIPAPIVAALHRARDFATGAPVKA